MSYLRRSLHDYFADLGVSSVEDVIETVAQQLGCFVHSAVYDRHRRWVEVFRPEFLEQLGALGRQLARLYDGAIATCLLTHTKIQNECHVMYVCLIVLVCIKGVDVCMRVSEWWMGWWTDGSDYRERRGEARKSADTDSSRRR